jgi:REP element-mobilizing transposase RayT
MRLLGRIIAKQNWLCLAYCLMRNHVHLLLETPEPNLGRGMQWLHGVYAQTFNERQGRCGHVFQGRFGSVPMRTDEQLLVAARYIALNPVEAGLCGEPADWAWSSHAAVMGGHGPGWLDVERLLAFFGMWGGDARRRYADFVRLR